MNRNTIIRLAMAAALAVAVLSVGGASVFAQTPTPTATSTPTATPGPGAGPGPGHRFGPGPFRQAPPAGGGVGLVVMERDQDRDRVMLHLRLQECDPQMLGVTVGGRWQLYAPGTPSWVHRDFPEQFRSGDPFFVSCSGVRPSAVLTEADTGGTVTLDEGDRVRVVLESNASTGFAWVVASAPSSSVLVPVGDPFYVPAASDLLGAPGYEVFEYRAVGTGSTSISLSYERTGTTEPPADTWSVNVVVN